MTLITIAIPCYNAEATIERAIKSALAQKWADKEILIVDDGSTDNSIVIAKNTIGETSNARILSNSNNLGPGGTRNRLLQEARGEFIVFFDDDDESVPERLSKQYDRIIAYEAQTQENLIACYASGIRHYPNGYKKDLVAIGSDPTIPKGPGLAASILYFGRNEDWFYGSGTPTCCLMARTNVLKQVGGFDDSFRRVEDLDLSIRLSLAGASFIGCKDILFIQHSTIGNDKTSEKNLEAELKLAEKYKDFLKTAGMYAYATTWPKIRYYHFTKQYGRFFITLLWLGTRYPRKVISHILSTGPKRLQHERRIAA